jgi:hypothetical protein
MESNKNAKCCNETCLQCCTFDQSKNYVLNITTNDRHFIYPLSYQDYEKFKCVICTIKNNKSMVYNWMSSRDWDINEMKRKYPNIDADTLNEFNDKVFKGKNFDNTIKTIGVYMECPL